MKKFIAPILSLSLVFATAIAVSAAPIVSGEVDYTLSDSHTSELEATINFDGKLSNAVDYSVSLDKDTTNPGDPVLVDKASLTYTNQLGQVQIGQFKYNPTVMDMMDTTNFNKMKDTFAVKVTPNLGENIHFAVGYQPNAGIDGFDRNGYQAELDYKLSMLTVGVNYQDLNDGSKAGTVWQAEVQPIETLKIYGEYGNKAGSEDEQGLVGALLTQGKLGVRGEYNVNNDDWAAKVSYKVNDNITANFKALNGTENQAIVSYTF